MTPDQFIAAANKLQPDFECYTVSLEINALVPASDTKWEVSAWVEQNNLNNKVEADGHADHISVAIGDALDLLLSELEAELEGEHYEAERQRVYEEEKGDYLMEVQRDARLEARWALEHGVKDDG